MKRRTFLQLGGMTAASALLAGCQSKNEKLIPYLIPPDEGVTPGKATYYASCCNLCPAGCGILVRVSEGRAKKIEGNPDHPTNRGRLCARGQALLQELYHPDRIQQPLKRTGPRGSGEFAKISWSEGLTLLTSRLKELQDKNNSHNLALLTPQLTGSLAALVKGFMHSFGSRHLISYDLLAPGWLRRAGEYSYGMAKLPVYDMAETRYVLSFGADFIENHLSPVMYGNTFGRMRQARDTVRGHFTYVGGRMSLTGASADRWMPARPGSEGPLALGMVRVILTEALYDRAALAVNNLKAESLLAHVREYDLPRVAGMTGLAPATISEVAREFAATRPSLALAGEAVAYQSNGQESVRAIQLLNLVVGNLNRPGGMYPSGSRDGHSSSLSDLQALVDSMQAGRIPVVLIKGDPCYEIPSVTGFQQALDKVPFTVSFATVIDDSALQADLILPDHSALESWGDVHPQGGSRYPVFGLMQPVVTPLYDTRQFGDVLLAAASQLEGTVAQALPQKSYRKFLKQGVAEQVRHKKGSDFEAQWIELLRRGGHFDVNKDAGGTFRWSPVSRLPNPAQPTFAGDQQQFPLHLQVYPSIAFRNGQGSSLPWLQQLPDPMSTVVWDSWIEINPATAASLRIKQGDLVEVSSVQGTLRLPAVIYPAIRPDLVAIPLGQGHRAGGRYAKDRGINPLTLLARVDGNEQLEAWNATRVRVTRVSKQGNLVTAGHPQGSYRSDLIGI